MTLARLISPIQEESPLLRVLCIVVSLFIVAGCTTSPRRPPALTRVDADTTVLPARIISNFFVVESVWPDGNTYRFLIDTGSTVSYITPELAKRFATKPRTSTPQNTTVQSANNGTITLPAVTLRKLILGSTTFEKVPALIYDCTELSAHLGLRLDGIIGFPVFRNTLLTLDYSGRQLILARTPQNPPPPPAGQHASTIAFNNEHGTPLIPIQMGNESFVVQIDTGSDGSLSLNPAGLHPVFANGPRIGPIVSSIHGDRHQLTGRLRQDVLIGTHTISQPIVDLTDNLSALGGELLRSFQLTFDQHRNQVTFTAADEHLITMPPRRSTGLSFARSPVYWRVLTVIPDTPTANLKIEPGDLCVRINGEPVEKWGYERYAALLKTAAKITFTFLNGTHETDLEVPLFELVP